jgi:hypothetical protein
MEYANNFIATSSRALQGVGYEPEARAGLNPESRLGGKPIILNIINNNL